MKLELSIMAGAESKAFLADLSKIVQRMEKAAGIKTTASDSIETMGDEDDTEELETASKSKKKTTKKAAASFDDDEDESAPAMTDASDDEDFTPKSKKTPKKAAASFDDDETEEEAEEPAPKKIAKTKKPVEKLTEDEVNQACKAHATENGVKVTKALLKKKFGSDKIAEIDEDEWSAVVKAVAV